MNLQLMKKLCSLDTIKLKKYILQYLYDKGYENIINFNSFMLAEGNIPVCIIVHIDTVFNHTPLVQNFLYDNNKKILWHPYGAGFDDRAGVYAIIQILEKNLKPHILFTDGEERGGIGATNAIINYPDFPFPYCNALIELDRANEKDMVFYECGNKDYIKFIERFGFKEAKGSFSDISILAPQWEIAAVNLSIGYIDEHTSVERLNCHWCDTTIEKVTKILETAAAGIPKFRYVPKPFYRYQPPLIETCLLCGGNENTLHYMNDTKYPYYVCDECYQKYF